MKKWFYCDDDTLFFKWVNIENNSFDMVLVLFFFHEFRKIKLWITVKDLLKTCDCTVWGWYSLNLCSFTSATFFMVDETRDRGLNVDCCVGLVVAPDWTMCHKPR